MKSIAFVIPWEGSLPNYFPFWLETCRQNPSIDFLVFTNDKTVYSYPDNVKSYYFSGEELRDIFRKRYEFEIAIEAPYKFCDFKPAYGEIFAEWLKGYDFWGHCDLDLFWGDIRKFLTDTVLDRYDRVYALGHCSLYRNTSTVNAWYRELPRCGCQDWKRVFQSPDSWCFDEWAGHCGGGLSAIMKANGIEIYNAVDMADLEVNRGRFVIHRRKELNKYNGLYFKYSGGKVMACCKEREVAEFLYVHFQKRRPIIKTEVLNEFYLIAPHIITDRPSKSHLCNRAQYVWRTFLRRVQKKIIEHR